MKNSKIIFLIIVLLILAGAGFNFSGLKNSFIEMKGALTLLGTARTSVAMRLNSEPVFNSLMVARNRLALVAFEKEDLDLFQTFFKTLLEKSFGLSSVSLNITKQYTSLNNEKVFVCRLQFTGEVRQFLKAINDNFPSLFVNKLEAKGNAFSADLYGYVTDEAQSFVYDNTVKAYSIFEQIGIVAEKNGKPLAGVFSFTEDGNIYFLKPRLEAKSYLVCKNAVDYINKNILGNKTFLILPINNDLSIRE
jgi:hypothetical protein